MDNGSPALEVGFDIVTGNSLGEVAQLKRAMAETEGQIVRQAGNIEGAVGGMVKLGPATAEFKTFGAAASREMVNLTAVRNSAEKAAERMVYALEREASTFGKTKSEIRDMRAELKAVAAENAGLTEVAGRLRSANAEMQRLEASAGKLTPAIRGTGNAARTVALQLPDITQGLLTSQPPMTVFIQQGFQIVQVAQMAEGGLRGFGKELGMLALRFAPVLVAVAAAGVGFALFNRWVNEGVKNEQLTAGLGKITGGADATKQELFKLKDATITWADTSKALFSVVGKDVAAAFVGDMKGMGKDVKSTLDDLTSYGRVALASLYAGVAGTKAYLGQLEKGGLTGLVKTALGYGDPDLLKKTYGAPFEAAMKYTGELGERVKRQALANARERLADKIGYNNQPKPKVDRHAETLERDARAVEAQIAGLYRLADAYGVSGAEALIAEARVKAETAAIRKRGDVEAFVDRQVRLAVAERVKAAAQNTAAMRDEARMQDAVNREVTAGNLPAQQSADLLRQRMSDLPLLEAIKAAHDRKDVMGEKAATHALDDHRIAQDKLTLSRRQSALNAAINGDAEQLEILREELRLAGATEGVRVRSLAILRAEQQARREGWSGADGKRFVDGQLAIADAQLQVRLATDAANASLTYQADLLDAYASNVQNAARGMADAFGEVGRAIGDSASIFASYTAQQNRLVTTRDEQLQQAKGISQLEDRIARERQINGLFTARTMTAQVGLYGDLSSAARGFFKEDSDGYRVATKAMQVFRAVEFALSIRAVAQDAIETGTSIANSVARTAVSATEAVVNAIKSLPFPLNLAAGAATVAAIASLGVSVAGAFGGGGTKLPVANAGTGTVLGDSDAKSESIKRAIDGLRDIDTLMLGTSRQMAASLRSIDSAIGGVAALVVRAGNVNASGGIDTGFQTNAVGSVLKAIVPIFGGALASLFGTKTTVVGSGLSGGPQALGSILDGGFDASYYSDVQKKKKLFGITTSTKYSTQYTGADAGLENQFTLILHNFNGAIVAAAKPLGEATDAIQNRLNGFVVNLGKIDLQGLTGTEIQEKLTAVFGAAADNMALAAFPGFERFQKVGEGAFETLVRVASTVEAVSSSLDLLGGSARTMSLDAKLGLADQFESVSALASAAETYFQIFYSKEEQAAAKTAQFAKAFDGLGMAMPATLDGFRRLVEAQDLTTAAGQSTYATLLQLAPAFADLQTAMDGAKSSADILAERQDLQRKVLELNGDTAAIRALDLAKVDVSNRALQEQVWAIEDAQKAAQAAEQLRDAWASVGDSIMDEVRRIRGLDASGGNSFAVLQGQFNAATTAARGGDQDAAKLLPALSQALLKSAGDVATSRQELDRVQSQTAASLEATGAVIAALAKGNPLAGAGTMAAAAMTAQAAAPTTASANDTTAEQLRQINEEIAAMRRDNNSGHAANASANQRTARVMEDVSAEAGGTAFAVVQAAA